MYKLKTRWLAGILTFIIMFSYLSIIGEAFASSQTATNQANVEFDVYFKENENKTYASIKNIGEENYLYTKIKVSNTGYLKNIVVDLNNPNFKVTEGFTAKEISKIENNKIYFNQILNGNTVELAIPIEMKETNNTISLSEIYKENTVKFTGTYVDGNGNEKQAKKDVTVNLAWTAEKYAELNASILKFMPIVVNGQKETILQMNIESYLKDNTLPVKEDKVELTIPNINGQAPEEVKVYGVNTEATNGENSAKSFTASNYNYDKSTGKLIITVSNDANANGEVSWKKGVKDEFVVTLIYKQEVTEAINVPVEISSQISMYEASITKATRRKSAQVTLKEQVGNLVDFEIENKNDSISKGQMYANYETTDKKETDYTQKIVANASILKVGETQVVDKLQMQVNKDNFVAQDGSKVETQGIIKEIKIAKTNFEKILGSEGTIKIYNEATLIGTINKNANVDENGNYIVNIAGSKLGSIKIETSTPKTEGKLEIEVTKQIGEITYSKAQAKNFTKIETSVEAQGLKGEATVSQGSIAKEITLIEPTSKAQIEIEPNQLSTIVTNENVKITGILETNTLECNLYKNPTLKIKLPKEIEEINIKNVEVLFETEGSKLTLKNSKVEEEQGSKIIKIELEGMQTNYNLGAVSKGVNVVITADLTVNKLTANKQEKVEMEYTNESTAETNKVETSINFVAPTGVVTTSTISNYKENAEKITAISGEGKTVTVETMSAARNVKYEMTVINNYNNTIDGISILGRIASKENTELGSNIEMPLTSGITVSSKDNSKVEIYYTENANADKDLSKQANGWTKTPADLSKVKSYLIVLKDYQMNTAEAINFTYEAQLPENMSYNQTANENYTVYFNNNLETGTVQDKAVSATITITTGKGPILETSISSNATSEITTGKFIKYTVKVKNAGKENTENVKVSVELPKCLSIINFFEGESGQYTKDYTLTSYVADIGTIKPNEEVEKSFWVVANKLTVDEICKDESHYETVDDVKYHKQDIKHSDDEYKTEISLKAVVTAKDLAKSLVSNEIKNTIKNGNFNIATSTTTNGLETLNEKDTFKYNISVKLYDASKTAKNTVVKTTIPNELDYEKAEIKKFNTEKNEYETTTNGIDFNTKTRVLTINLGDVTAQSEKTIEITSKVKALGNGKYEKTINSVATVSADGMTEETSNTIIDTIGKEGIEVTQTASIPGGNTLSAGEKLSYKFTIKNIGGNMISNLNLIDNLPAEVEYINTTYTISGETKTVNNINSGNKTTLTINIPKGETAVVTINVMAKQLEQKANIENIATISTDTISMETNKIAHVIEATQYDKPGDITTIVRKISGQVWKDENNDGIKDESEAKVEGVEVILFNNQTGSIVTDKDGNMLKTVTDKEGKYEFSSIAKGKYTVIFLYDTANYSATTYRKENVEDTKNSDAIDSKIAMNGEERIAGITEEIDATESNIYNIDLGLVSNPKFDLKLDKTVTKITVQDGKNTDVYSYNDVKIAKKDLIGKDVNNTSIIVEYKLKVTNEGAIAGYVKKLVDYMPSEMKFNSELNSDWYTAENGTLYNSSLANTLIKPGESKEVTLVLTKKMTEENLGLYHNTAEIYEAYNDLGISDVDSTPGNKANGEDDISSADVLITLKTGKTITFFGLTIVIISSITVGAYFIKKKVLR